jgi:hypothetical protein
MRPARATNLGVKHSLSLLFRKSPLYRNLNLEGAKNAGNYGEFEYEGTQ